MRFIYLFLLSFLLFSFCGNEEKSNLKDGDLIFQSSTSSQSQAIELATKSNYSHVGIVCQRNNEFYVYEAIQPVSVTPLDEWISRGKNGHYAVKRLKNRDKILTTEALRKMKKVGERFYKKNYDIYFEWSNDRMYCSELVWKIYKEALGIELGQLQELKDFDLSSDIVKEKMKERYGENVPWSEKVISPEAIFRSENLELIVE